MLLMKKKNKKNGILILSVFLVFLVIGAVSATNDVTDSVNNIQSLNEIEDNDTVLTNTVEDNGCELSNYDSQDYLQTSEGSFSDLNSFISNNRDYSAVLKLDKDYVFNSEQDSEFIDGIDLNNGFYTIDGQGHVIDANNIATNIFTVRANGIVFNNITFKNVNDGHALTIYGQDNIVQYCLFE